MTLRAPGPLREAAGFHYLEFSSLGQPLLLKDDPFHARNENKVSDGAGMLIPDTAQPLAYYDHPFFGKYITRNSFGKGTFSYEGTVLSDKLQSSVLLDVFEHAGLRGPDQTLPAAVRVKHAMNRNGRTVHFYVNSSEPQTISDRYAAGTDVLTEGRVAHGQSMALKPWDAAIMRRNENA